MNSIERLRPAVEVDLVRQHVAGWHSGRAAQYGRQVPYQCPVCRALEANREAHANGRGDGIPD